ncbi:hypothetical protein ElyMa_006588000 [Elysia marginata]|uniref:Uncharacterized protein n=1 Tax=Elysia marginata TaxID=1093978 RepID=A0AAV4IFM2_9GAST|nr:hypothetical protein ElyMa_006588000 [Elysia marginata]
MIYTILLSYSRLVCIGYSHSPAKKHQFVKISMIYTILLSYSSLVCIGYSHSPAKKHQFVKISVVKLVTFDPVLRAVTEIGEGSRGLTAGLRLNCSSRGLVSLGVVSVVESRV